MLTKEFKEEALKKLENMTAEDFIKVFEKIGSKRTEKNDNLYSIVEGDLERYGILNKFNSYMIVPEHNIKIANTMKVTDTDKVYSKDISYVLAA